MSHLSSRKVETLKAPGRHNDGDGLYLEISKNGRKTWLLRYQMRGRRRDMGLGPYPAVGLADARFEAANARKQIHQNLDPITERRTSVKREKPLPLFSEIAERVIADVCKKSTNKKVRYRAKLLLGETYCKKLLNRQINSITSSDLARILNEVQEEKPETTRKLHGLLSKVFETARIVLRDEYDVVLGTLPTDLKDLKALGYDPRVKNVRHPALHWREAPEFVRVLRSRDGISHRALETLMLTGLRESDVAAAQWSEINLEEELWTIPPHRLKDRNTRTEPHRVPLSSRLVEILSALKDLHPKWVFPGLKPGMHLSPQSPLQALKKLNKDKTGKPVWIDCDDGRPVVVHGFRSTLRTWAEDNGFRNEVAEQSLGHAVGSKVEARYRRTDILKERRIFIQAWDDYCSGAADNKIVRLATI